MRCDEVRNRIDRGVDPASDEELREHLTVCAKCARIAETSGLLGRFLSTAAEDDTTAVPSLQFTRTQVTERLAASVKRSPIVKHIWLKSHRPALISAAVVTVAFMVLSLVPFKSYQTIGYDLKLAGVDRDLATDDEKVCGILHGLGLHEAAVDVGGCDTTCELSILDLKSEREAFLVVGAIATLNDFDLTSDIKPIRAQRSASIWQQARRILEGGES